jgi:hypothetical protein
MPLFRLWLNNPLLALLWHIALGVVTRYMPAAFTAYYVLIITWGVYEIIQKRDRGYLTAYYVMYVMGMEIVYRVGKFYIFWELGKYGCIALLLAGLIATPQKRLAQSWPFLIFGLLLIPGIAAALYYGHTDVTYLRKIILQHISGPISLMMAGLYLYKTTWQINWLERLFRIAILPSIALVIFLFLKSSISSITFSSSSNYSASGGFGPNQVSTALGYGMVLLMFSLLNGWTLTINKIIDIGLLVLLIFRGLLTFSRGGVGSAIIATIIALIIIMIFNSSYRKKFWRLTTIVIIGVVTLAVIAIIANQLTDNYLLYRYQNKSGTDILYLQRDRQQINTHNRTLLSGREIVVQEELKSFASHPFVGIGAGRGTLVRQDVFHYSMASHTEQTRLLGEHGLFGLIIIIIFFITIPFYHFLNYSNSLSRHWFLQSFLLVMLTMLHASMRLAMPGILFGLAFIVIQPAIKSKAKNATPATA